MSPKLLALIPSRSDFACLASVLSHLIADELSVRALVFSGALLDQYGDVRDSLAGIEFTAIPTHVAGARTPGASLGLAMTRLEMELEAAEGVLVVGDRWESLVALIGAYDNIPIIHIQGGERSGNIDDRVRDALTVFASLHLVSTEQARQALGPLARGEIHVTGCPSLDLCPQNLSRPPELASLGSGAAIEGEYLLVIQHPVTTEYLDVRDQFIETIQAIHGIGMPTVWITPNVDAGNELASKALRQCGVSNIRWFHHFAPETFWKVLANASAIVGNSSAGIRQAPYLGVPAVDIGSRQHARERIPECRWTDYRAEDIEAAILDQILHGSRTKSWLYGDGHSGRRCADIIKRWFSDRV
jgi:UDP-hydrolysing UDP-N-acetyl-D-glucosamine 2-epimerase